MDIRELKRIINEIDPDEFVSPIYVIVGREGERAEASGVDVASVKLAFDNGGPVLLIEIEE